MDIDYRYNGPMGRGAQQIMLKTIKQFFDDQLSPKGGSIPGRHTLEVAAAALLFEVSRANHDTKDGERQVITELIKRQFHLEENEATTLISLAEEEVHHATSLHQFVSLINENWTEQQRLRLVEHMWQVAYADQHLNDHEVHLMRKIQRLLYIPHKKFIGAKLRAKEPST